MAAEKLELTLRRISELEKKVKKIEKECNKLESIIQLVEQKKLGNLRSGQECMATTDCIRPPPHMVKVRKFSLCKYYPRCYKAEKCTYAHSEEEKIVWNKLVKSRKRPGQWNNPLLPKRHKTDTSKTKELITTCPDTSISEGVVKSIAFVETEVYRDLLKRVRNMTVYTNNIQIFGPKGTGKTSALLKLNEVLPDSCYIDLATGCKTLDCTNQVILIDNAQLFSYDIECMSIRNKKVIAAFSPGALCKTGSKCLTKRCGDGRESYFFWRPFTFDEVKCLVSELGFTAASKTNMQQKEISRKRLRKIFCRTNGNPKFILSYLEDFNLSYMGIVLYDQFKMMVCSNDLGGTEVICKSLVAILRNGEGCFGDIPSVIGAAYCTNFSGGGKWKLAHTYYGYKAAQHLGQLGQLPSASMREDNNQKA